MGWRGRGRGKGRGTNVLDLFLELVVLLGGFLGLATGLLRVELREVRFAICVSYRSLGWEVTGWCAYPSLELGLHVPSELTI